MSVQVERTHETEHQVAVVTIVIPCRAEYVAIARLAILGVANRLEYSYDEVEDVRLAVGEACTHAVERARWARPGSAEPTIWIESRISPTGLEIEVRDNIAPLPAGSPPPVEDDDLGIDKQDLGALLMEILVDKFSVRETPGGTTVALLKTAPQPSSVAD